MPLDEQLPRFDRRELHSRRVAATPAQVLVAAREVTAREVPLLVVLMALRSGPRLRRRSLGRPILGEFERSGFVRLAEADDELVYGGVGRFWTPSGGIRRISAQEFEGFAHPGYAKTAFNFLARPLPDGGTLLSTETRVLATDPAALSSFCRYWRLIRPGSGAIRWGWLRGIARRAERAQAARSESASSSRSTSSSVV